MPPSSQQPSRRKLCSQQLCSRQPSLRHRTALVLCVGIALTLCGLAVVSIVPRALRPPEIELPPNLDLPPALRAELERVASRAPATVVWRTVSDLETRFGRYVRLRPYAHGIEVRGADLVVTPAAVRPEFGETTADWSGVETLAQRAESDPFHLRLVRWHERAAQSHFWIALDPADARPSGRLSVRWPGASARIGGAARVAEMPWNGAPPEIGSPGEFEFHLSDDGRRVVLAADSRLLRREARALVFSPNPVVTSGSRTFSEEDPADRYRVWRALEELDGSGRLRGARVRVESGQAPVAYETGDLFAYPSYDPRFEECMAYVHADHALARAEEVGVSIRGRLPLTVRVHASALDASWYAQTERAVFLGDGGVDDAEDADIILHEVGHALHDAILPGFGGGDTRAISEGFADYWAASLTDGTCLAEWDATGYGSECLRRVDTNAHYPESLTGRPHTDGQIWSGLLWDLRTEFGADAIDRLALHSFFEQDTDSSLPAAGAALVRAAIALGWGDEVARVREAVGRRGLGPWQVVTELSSGETVTVALPPGASIWGQSLDAVRIGGDGSLRFEGPGGAPVLEASPLVSSLVEGGASADLPRIRVTVLVEERSGEIDLRYSTLAGDGPRALLRWEESSARLLWTYLSLPREVAWPLTAALREPDEAISAGTVAFGSIPPDGIELPPSFTMTLPEPACQAEGAEVAFERLGGVLRANLRVRPSGCDPGPRLLAHPNPTAGEVTLRLAPSTAGRDSWVDLFDASGRRVRRLESRSGGGVAFWRWDGRDDAGRALPAGVYFARASDGNTGAGRGVASNRLVLVR